METLKDKEQEIFSKYGVSPESVKMLEEESLMIATFTNTDDDDFEGMWGGKAKEIKSGETIMVPRFLAEHYAKQLADKILLRKDNLGDELGRKKIYGECLSEPKTVVAPKEEVAEAKVEEFSELEETPEEVPEVKPVRRRTTKPKKV